MSENTSASNPSDHTDEIAPSVGQTGGLPGRNAAPQTAQMPAEELADTVNVGVDAPTAD